MVRGPGSTGRYAPESGPIMLRVSFVVHDPERSCMWLSRVWSSSWSRPGKNLTISVVDQRAGCAGRN
jgi:hypothetical protein